MDTTTTLCLTSAVLAISVYATFDSLYQWVTIFKFKINYFTIIVFSSIISSLIQTCVLFSGLIVGTTNRPAFISYILVNWYVMVHSLPNVMMNRLFLFYISRDKLLK